MLCSKCNGELLATEKLSSVSGAGLVGALIAFVGLLSIFANVLVGIALIILGAIIGSTMRGKKLMLICPACKTSTPAL